MAVVPVVALFTLGRSDNDVEHDNEWRWFVIILGIPCLVSSIGKISIRKGDIRSVSLGPYSSTCSFYYLCTGVSSMVVDSRET